MEVFSKGQVVFPKQGQVFQVEIAETASQRTHGLMYRRSMAANKGMLFVFEQAGVQRVWMKNTLIALDIIFLSKQGKIVSILQNIQPCKQPVCKVYTSKKSAKYMLEIKAGKVKKAGLTMGQQFVFNRL
ncbi:MAG: DUF192 domain-containing protein [Methylococcales bacterium]